MKGGDGGFGGVMCDCIANDSIKKQNKGGGCKKRLLMNAMRLTPKEVAETSQRVLGG